MNAWHPRAFGYFTPAPLWAAIGGELLAQVAQPGHRHLARRSDRGLRRGGGRPLALRPRRLPDRAASASSRAAASWPTSWPSSSHATSGWRELRGLDRPPRGSDLDGARVYVSDQTHFSVARALSIAGFPADTLVSIPADERFRLQAGPVAAAIDADRRCRPDAARDRRDGRDDEHGLGRRARGPRRPRGGAGPVVPRRRRLRWRRSTVPAARRSRAGVGAGRLAHDRPAQVVLPAARRRRAARPRRERPRAHVRVSARVLPRWRRPDPRAGRPWRRARLLPSRHGGHAPVARAEAVALLEAPRDARASVASSR